MAFMLYGSELSEDQRSLAKRMFVHRFTREHKPAWTNKPRPDGSAYEPQFKSDDEWLMNTRFWVTEARKISRRHKHCESCPTWPSRSITQ